MIFFAGSRTEGHIEIQKAGTCQPITGAQRPLHGQKPDGASPLFASLYHCGPTRPLPVKLSENSPPIASLYQWDAVSVPTPNGIVSSSYFLTNVNVRSLCSLGRNCILRPASKGVQRLNVLRPTLKQPGASPSRLRVSRCLLSTG
jgi:hypothetical protein